MSDQNQQNLPATPQSTESGGLIQKIDAIAPEGWRMKIAKVAAQLIAGTERGALAYAAVRERIDTNEGRSTVSKALAEAVAQQAVNDPETLERAKARFLSSALQKQENLEAVIVGASQNLLTLPPPKAENASSRNDASVDEPIKSEEVNHEALNTDWASTFTSIAENATTVELRDRLAKVLAGEIVSPGTFSRATVRLISELERNDLEAAHQALPFVLNDMLIRSRNDTKGISHDLMLKLVEAGLLTDASGMLAKQWPATPDDETPIGVCGKEWMLAIYLKDNNSFSLPMSQLTRTGVAVMDLLGRPDEREILRLIAKESPDNTYSKIVLGRFLGNGKMGYPSEQLFPVPTNLNLTVPGTANASPFSPVNFAADEGRSKD